MTDFNHLPFEFILEGGKAKMALDSARSFHDLAWPAEDSYRALAHQMVACFLAHPGLESLSLTCLLKTELDETDDAHVVKLHQHFKLSTLGAEVFQDLSEKATFMANYAPVHLMGSGTIHLKKDDPEVVQVVSDPLTPDSVAAIHLLAQRLQSAFKTIDIAYQGGQFLG